MGLISEKPKTLAERIGHWFRVQMDSEVEFQNPIEVKIGSCLSLDLIDFLDPLNPSLGTLQDLEFVVQEVRIAERPESPDVQGWVDYDLDAETESGIEIQVRLRAQVQKDKTIRVLVLQFWDRVAYDSGFEEILQDCDSGTSTFSIDALEESYIRRTGTTKPVLIQVTRYRDQDLDGVITESEVRKKTILYRDYVLDNAPERLMFIEQDADSHESEIWRGREVLLSEIKF